MKTAGIILMGGKARRLNGIQKPYLKLQDKTCLERIIYSLKNNLDEIAINVASKAQAAQLSETYSIIYDATTRPELTGIHAAFLGIIDWAQKNKFDQIITTSGDTPFLPSNYIDELIKSSMLVTNRNVPIVSVSNNRIHGLHALWPATVLQDLKSLIQEAEYLSMMEIHRLLDSMPHVFEVKTHDPFLNINTTEDYNLATKLAEKYAI